MNKRIRNHHYVPKALQRSFCFEKERIWYSERVDGLWVSGPVVRNIETAFRIKDFYTVLENGNPSDIVERNFYGKIDNYLGVFIPSALSALNRFEVPVFSDEAIQGLRIVVFEMLKRTPEFTKHFDDDETIGRKIAESALADLIVKAASASNIDEMKSRLTNRPYVRQIGRGVRVKAIIKNTPRVDDALSEFTARWAYIEGRPSYLLSSTIVYRKGNGDHNGLSNKNMEIWMPISPKFALVLLRDPHNTIPLIMKDGEERIRELNEYIVESSNAVASHSDRLISRFTGFRR